MEKKNSTAPSKMEDLSAQFSSFREENRLLSKRLEEVEKLPDRMAALENRVAKVESQLSEFLRLVGVLSQGQSDSRAVLDALIDQLKSRVTSVEGAASQAEQRFATIDQKFAGIVGQGGDIERVVGRLKALEQKLVPDIALADRLDEARRVSFPSPPATPERPSAGAGGSGLADAASPGNSRVSRWSSASASGRDFDAPRGPVVDDSKEVRVKTFFGSNSAAIFEAERAYLKAREAEADKPAFSEWCRSENHTAVSKLVAMEKALAKAWTYDKGAIAFPADLSDPVEKSRRTFGLVAMVSCIGRALEAYRPALYCFLLDAAMERYVSSVTLKYAQTSVAMSGSSLLSLMTATLEGYGSKPNAIGVALLERTNLVPRPGSFSTWLECIEVASLMAQGAVYLGSDPQAVTQKVVSELPPAVGQVVLAAVEPGQLVTLAYARSAFLKSVPLSDPKGQSGSLGQQRPEKPLAAPKQDGAPKQDNVPKQDGQQSPGGEKKKTKQKSQCFCCQKASRPSDHWYKTCPYSLQERNKQSDEQAAPQKDEGKPAGSSTGTGGSTAAGAPAQGKV